jgi:hypothetical protein
MSVDLIGSQINVHMSNRVWHYIRQLAMRHNWEPAGTVYSSGLDEPWCGAYDSNDGQVVTAEDAWALAMALKQGYADIPVPNLIPPIPTVLPSSFGPHNYTDNLYECLSGPHRSIVIAVMCMCNFGEFSIH